MLKVASSASIGIPNVGSLFTISGSVSVMFNTTRQDQEFKIPDAFLPLLHPGDPTHDHDLRLGARASTGCATRTRRRAARSTSSRRSPRDHDRRRHHAHRLHPDRGRGGRRQPACGSRSPAPSARRSRSSARSPARSTSTSSSATDDPGVVGRVFLALDSNQIPGRRPQRPVPARDQHVRDRAVDRDLQDQEGRRSASLRRLRARRRGQASRRPESSTSSAASAC